MTTKPQADSQRSDSPVEPSFGWNAYAERVNGRFAMMGFVILLGLELVSGQDLFTWLGLR
ncbi:chlorophyll a/b-binding protein [Chamaesiphon sp.]|uniref:chlorophyll a/b-binding protein n=1 Tax=Chamaesiphon sp. TaxID=2814140 RepID=UPI0035930664